MTARTIVIELALTGFASLLVASSGLAETRLISVPNGVAVPAAAPDSPRCCTNGETADSDGGAVAAASIPNSAGDGANLASSVAGGDPTPGAAFDPSVSAKVDIDTSPATPRSGWRQFLSGIVQEAATNR